MREYNLTVDDYANTHGVNIDDTQEQNPLIAERHTAVEVTESVNVKKVEPVKKQRLISLDVFRGITIWTMMLVNHADGGWHGVTIADFVMPLFLFIVGASVSLSMVKSVERQTETKTSLFKKISIRTIKLFILGILLQGGDFPNFDLQKVRPMGVLQRIAIVYFTVSICMIFIPRVSSSKIDNWIAKSNFKAKAFLYATIGAGGIFDVFIRYIGTWLVCLVTIVFTLIITFAVPVPDCGRGQLTTRCNVAGYLDELIISPPHMFGGATCKQADPPCINFEPEGILSTIAALTSGFIGLYFGHTLNRYPSHMKRLLHWLVLGLFMLVVSLILHFTVYPFNKNLYTYSFVLLMGGSSALLLVLCYSIVDVPKSKFPKYLSMPFIVLGMNAIAIYVIDELLPIVFGYRQWGGWFYWRDRSNGLVPWVYRTFFTALPDKWAIFCYALTDTFIMIIIASVFYRRKLFFKV
ncbi:heparan-alpha-glucosaminide N-acetyltransferase [Acrasis kona]|uniref:Heparan-alpha-glucosaminide N-acetyltransferase n=1 Tax=Acrasis kona TaxID=1008807 RepID=A0AAW2YRU0_9EUKA